MTCPDPDTLARFASGQAPPGDQEALRLHVDGCSACRELLVVLVRESQGPAGAQAGSPWDVPPRGSLLGRYRVLEPLGVGGMGLVLSAQDTQLDRTVALKLLRPDLAGEDPGRGKARLLREAQVMARVRHPNVVTVHDVFEADGRVVIAMEHIAGRTLRELLEERPRTRDEVLRLFLAAGRGLAAAHAAGVVHRDFKAENVLVDATGGVHVSDFGLAWSRVLPEPAPSAPAGAAAMTSGLTRDTAVLGTPAYMAPEQLRGDPVDGRADQFSFCVALTEALTGARPFQGRTTAALLTAIEAGASARASPQLPGRLVRALRRGLSARPGERFSSMETLLAALAPPSRGPWAAAATVAGLLGVAVLALRLLPAPCEAPLRRAEATWSAPRRATLAGRFASSGAPTGPASWRAVEARLDGLVAALASASAAACAMTPGDAQSRALVCLESRVEDLEMATTLFEGADAVVVANAPLVAARLEGPDACAAGELVTTAPLPKDPASRARIAHARLLAVEADALRTAGKLREGEETARRAIAEARATGYRPVEADALLALAEALRVGARYAEAEKALGEALLAAEAGRHFEGIARICVQHVLVVGTQSMRPDDAEVWLTRARGALEQMPRPALEAEVLLATSLLRLAQDRPVEGATAAARAVALFEAQGNPARAHDARLLQFQSLMTAHRTGDALPLARAVDAGRAALLGRPHPQTLKATLLLGEVLARAGHAAEAKAVLEGALGLAKTVDGFPAIARLAGEVSLAEADALLAHPVEAQARAAAVKDTVLTLLGPGHRYSGAAWLHLARVEREAGVLASAIDHGATALGTLSAALGDAHPETLEALVFLAALQLEAGHEAEAAALLEELGEAPRDAWPGMTALRVRALLDGDLALAAEAVAAARALRGPLHPDVAEALAAQGELAARAHDDVLARRLVGEAAALLEGLGIRAFQQGRWRERLAALSEPASRCAELAKARVAFIGAGARAASDLVRVEASARACR